MTAIRAESVLGLLWVAAWLALLLWVAGEVGWSSDSVLFDWDAVE